MGIIAWIALGMAAALLANMLLLGERSRRLIFIINAELGSFPGPRAGRRRPLARPAATANGTAVS